MCARGCACVQAKDRSEARDDSNYLSEEKQHPATSRPKSFSAISRRVFLPVFKPITLAPGVLCIVMSELAVQSVHRNQVDSLVIFRSDFDMSCI